MPCVGPWRLVYTVRENEWLSGPLFFWGACLVESDMANARATFKEGLFFGRRGGWELTRLGLMICWTVLWGGLFLT